MLTRYYCVLLGILALFAITMAGYFWYSAPADSANRTTIIKTTYETLTVKGPIQPIPAITEVDLPWARLGKALFNSKLLSKDNSIACSSCHLVDFGGDDGFPVSTGINNQLGSRNSPTVLNSTFSFRQFWDGRSKDLADQVAGPIHDVKEMGSNWQEVVDKLRQSSEFRQTFLELSPEGVTPQNIIRAITIYEETLITPNAPIDRYLLGDKSALTEQQARGYQKFINFGCVTCHQGRNIGGNLYQRIGRMDVVPSVLLEDEGLYAITQQEGDRFVFKVPSLRNIADTAPYFHNGSVNSLSEAIQIMAKGQLGLSLNKDDVEDLVALLHAFSGKPYRIDEHASQ